MPGYTQSANSRWFPSTNIPGANVPPPATSPLANQYKLYNSGVQQNAEDYSGLMKNYQDLYAKSQAVPQLTPGKYTPQMTQYNASPDYTSAMQNLTGLSQSGGYNPDELANLRERAISPIRSIYAGANREVDRNRALQGGYSPNYNATKAKMAREQSSSIADQMTNVNAGIAQNVAQNRLGVAPQLANIAQQESGLQNQMNTNNSNTANTAAQFNLDLPFKAGAYNQNTQDMMLKALSGQSNLYGTTPAMSNLFGNQAMTAAQLQQLMKQQNNSNMTSGLGLVKTGSNMGLSGIRT